MKHQLFLVAIAAGTLWAQEPHTFVFNRTIPDRLGEQMMARPLKGAPYSADAVTETSQVLADGNRIVDRQTAFVARDSQGRTRNDAALKIMGKATASGEIPFKLIMIHDPIAQVTYTLESATKTARKVSTASTPQAVEADAKKRAAEKAHTEAAIHERRAEPLHRLAASVKTESLGTQMIEGVMAEGTRRTETIAAGAIGNEKDIQVVNEVWTAQDLKAIVLSKHSDPRTGEVTFKLTNIQRAEPAASMFEVPADYQIVEGPTSKEVFFHYTPNE